MRNKKKHSSETKNGTIKVLLGAGARLFRLVKTYFSDWEKLAKCVAKEIDDKRNWETDLESEEEESELKAVKNQHFLNNTPGSGMQNSRKKKDIE